MSKPEPDWYTLEMAAKRLTDYFGEEVSVRDLRYWEHCGLILLDISHRDSCDIKTVEGEIDVISLKLSDNSLTDNERRIFGTKKQELESRKLDIWHSVIDSYPNEPVKFEPKVHRGELERIEAEHGKRPQPVELHHKTKTVYLRLISFLAENQQKGLSLDEPYKAAREIVSRAEIKGRKIGDRGAIGKIIEEAREAWEDCPRHPGADDD